MVLSGRMWTHELTAGLDLSLKPEPLAASPAENSTQNPAGKLPIALMGVSFDPLTLDQAVARIEEMVAERKPNQIVTANVDFLAQCQGDVELHRILLDAQLVVCDGTPLVWASRLLGNPLPERVAGSDLVPRLMGVAAEKKYRLFLLGSTPEANAQAVSNLTRQYPGLIVAGHYSPPFRGLLEMDHEEIAQRIRESRPDIMLVSLGCPKQEKWIAMHYRALGVPVTIGVGAVIDFLAGRFRRAPGWARAGGVEWLYRLLQEPRRLFRRYAWDLWHFGLTMLRQIWTLQLAGGWRRQEPRPIEIMTEPDWQRIVVPERLDARTLLRDAAYWRKTGRRHCLLDVSDVQFVDSTGIGWLVQLRRVLRREGRQLVLIAPSVPMLRALAQMHLNECFLVAPDAVEARRLILELSEACRPAIAHSVLRPLLVQNEITAANVDETWQVLASTIRGSCARRKKICFDLSKVGFIDSTGLGLLIRTRKEAQHLGVTLHYSAVQNNVRNVLRMAGLEKTLLEN
jgi:N-acetylglucosaminyldiphosphoundecaprenol N-acetyl-beta-D-mannosaminyltransferase